MVIGANSKLLLIASGVIFLGDGSSMISWVGVMLSITGGVIYGIKTIPWPSSLGSVASNKAAPNSLI